MRKCFFLLLLAASAAAADTVYIHDVLYVPLRGGQSQEHRIVHRGLKSGTKLERLETNSETGYTRVRMENGMEGWLPSQYLVEDPIAATKLADLESIQAEHQQGLLRLRETREQLEAANTELEALRSLSAADIQAENERLRSEITGVRSDMNDLRARNAELETSTTRQWFLAGGSTVLIGLLFGFWIGRRIYHRRNTGGWA